MSNEKNEQHPLPAINLIVHSLSAHFIRHPHTWQNKKKIEKSKSTKSAAS